MANTMKPIPQGYHSVTPYIICKGAAEAIAVACETDDDSAEADWPDSEFGALEVAS